MNPELKQDIKPDQLQNVLVGLMKVMKEQGMTPQELMNIYQGGPVETKKENVPISIFAGKLSPSESLSKYLRENASLSFKEISVLLKRDERSIWTSYKRAKSKMPEPFRDVMQGLFVPIKIFARRELSILENLVIYLNENTDQTNYRIAKSLNKIPSMIYTIYRRAKKKLRAQPECLPILEVSRPVQQRHKVKKKKKRGLRGILG